MKGHTSEDNTNKNSTHEININEDKTIEDRPV